MIEDDGRDDMTDRTTPQDLRAHVQLVRARSVTKSASGATFRVNATPPHQGKREAARRLKQIRAGTLSGPVVSPAARYAAHGLVDPATLSFVERPDGQP